MYRKFTFALSVLSLFACQAQPARGQMMQDAASQQINDFSVAGFGERGRKTWDISAKSADIFQDIIKLKDITGNLYGEKEDVKLTASDGNYDKAAGTVHLEKDVVVTTSSGARMITESLDWDRQKEVVASKDVVSLQKDNITTIAQGASLNPGLSTVTLQKDVTVEVKPLASVSAVPGQDDKNRTTITCDGPLEIDYGKNIATFRNDVRVVREDIQIYSDAMDVYFIKSGEEPALQPVEDMPAAAGSDQAAMLGSKIDRIVARGNVKMVRGENVSYSNEAVYSAIDRKVTLTGRPKLVIYSTEDMSASLGN